MLIRDYANPSDQDPYFPFTRSFDWFHGHSWAKGLFESGDGKDQESTSEDTFATYALKMWGRVTGDAAMEARANLQLAVQARSLRNYFLLSSDNKVQPASFIPNKVTGILFENKVDHTTYFGADPAFVQGIHMIPLNPSSMYTRPKQFVQEEWDRYFSEGRADKAEGGWKGILYANLALVDPVKAYQFFSDPAFDMGTLDGGASRTWYLAFAAGLGGGGQAVPVNSESEEEMVQTVANTPVNDGTTTNQASDVWTQDYRPSSPETAQFEATEDAGYDYDYGSYSLSDVETRDSEDEDQGMTGDYLSAEDEEWSGYDQDYNYDDWYEETLKRLGNAAN